MVGYWGDLRVGLLPTLGKATLDLGPGSCPTVALLVGYWGNVQVGLLPTLSQHAPPCASCAASASDAASSPCTALFPLEGGPLREGLVRMNAQNESLVPYAYRAYSSYT